MSTQSEQRRLVVTGAAAGIGRAVTRAARRRGWAVIGLDRERIVDDELITGLRCDIADEASVTAAFAELDAHWPDGIDAAVHCAGIYRVEPTTDTSATSWDTVLGVNARGSMLVAREAGRRMLERTGDRAVVLLSSIGASRGDAAEPSAAYSASKGAIESLTRQLAVEWGRAGVRVNAVAPGVIDTAMTTMAEDAEAAAEFFRTRVPLGRMGEADEVAEVCAFLASPAASYVSGAIVPVDGGEGVQ